MIYNFSISTVIILILLACFNINAQNNNNPEEQYLAFAQVMPELQGGLPGLTKEIKYPEVAKKIGIEGKVFAMAFVNEKGSVDQVKIIKGIGGGCDEEVIRVLKSANFKPGEQEGKPVKVKTALSIVFKIQK